MVLKTEFRGTPMIPKGIKFPEFGMMTGDFGKEFLAEYIGRAKADYNSLNVLGVLSYEDGKVTGSNTFAVVLANSIVRGNGLRTATPADVERALQAGVDLRGVYVDTGLVLRSRDNPNSYLAKSLSDQVALRTKLKFPAVIPLTGLELVKDSSSPQGLAFKLRDDAQIIYAPVLRQAGSFTSDDVNLKTGLPRKVGQSGDRNSYVTDSGLSRLYLIRDLNLGSGYENLASSDSGGRVCVVSGEATSQKLDEFVVQLKVQRKEAEIKLARIAQAEKALKGQ